MGLAAEAKPIRLERPIFIRHYWLAPDAEKKPFSPMVGYRWNKGDGMMRPLRQKAWDF